MLFQCWMLNMAIIGVALPGPPYISSQASIRRQRWLWGVSGRPSLFQSRRCVSLGQVLKDGGMPVSRLYAWTEFATTMPVGPPCIYIYKLLSGMISIVGILNHQRRITWGIFLTLEKLYFQNTPWKFNMGTWWGTCLLSGDNKEEPYQALSSPINRHYPLWTSVTRQDPIYSDLSNICPLKRDHFVRKFHLPTINFEGQKC